LREEHRLRVFENRVLRRTFVPKRDEVTGKWRKLHHEEFDDLYISLKIENNETDGACSAHEGEEMCTGFWWGR
jgi:hypothetical protein